jgi:hypothetical protein
MFVWKRRSTSLLPAWTKRHDQKLCKNTCSELIELLERIGRLREKNGRIAQDYSIDVIADGEKNKAIRIERKRELKAA